MAYYSYNSDIKVENLIDLSDDIDLYNLNISENKSENNKPEIEYPNDLLEILNKQCYYLQILSLESTFDKTISLAYLNEEIIILDVKLANFLRKCDELKGISDTHKELVSGWLSKGLKTYDTIVQQLHRFFNTKKNDSVSDDRDSNELIRLKEREDMILDIQRDRQNLNKEAEELEVMRRRFEMNEQRVLNKEKTFDFIENERTETSIEGKKIFDFENESKLLMKLKNTIEYTKYEKQEKQIDKQTIFNLENKDEIKFKEGLNKIDNKTSTRKNQQDDTSSQFSNRDHSVKNEPGQNMNQDLYQLFYNQQELNKKLANKNSTQLTLPPVEPMTFDGDYTKYKEFLISFHTNIESKCDSEMHKLNYLMKYTKGEPNNIVSSCIHLDENQCFIKAKQMLEKQYGNPNRIAQSFLKKLKDWKEITREDKSKINELYFDLNQIKNNMESMTLLNQLNSLTEILNIVKKLPMFLQRKWKQRAFEIYKRDEQVAFIHLVEFMEEQSEYVSIPVFDEIGYTYKDTKKESNKEKMSKGKTFFTQQKNESSKEQVQRNNFKANKYCPYCEQNNHFLNTCKEIEKIKHNDKVEFIKKNRLCFKCLKNNHFSSQCLKPEVCSICQMNHLTILH